MKLTRVILLALAFAIPFASTTLASAGEEAATERFEAQGLAGFIQKPYRLDALIAKIWGAKREGHGQAAP